MAYRRFMFIAAVLVILGGWQFRTLAEGEVDKTPETAMDPGAMAAWMQAAQPGPEHQNLAFMIGAWTTTSMTWFAGPDAPATTTRGTAECRWILGGRYVQMVYRSTMMGMPFEGISISGFDRARNVYCDTWVDNMSTGPYTSTGAYDAKKKVFTYHGQMNDPVTKIYGYTVKSRITILGPDHFKFEMFNPHQGESAKMMEVIYQRQQ